MATKKAPTEAEAPVEEQIEEVMPEQVEDQPEPVEPTEAEAPVEDAEYTTLKSPQGYATTVPRDIVAVLLDAGYVVVK